MTVIEVAPGEEAESLITEIEGADSHGAMHAVILLAGGGGHGVAEGIADISRHRQPQPLDRGVVDTKRPGVAVGNLVFIRRGRSVMDPALRTKPLAVEAGHEHQLVTPVAGLSPEGDADFMPGAGHYGVLPFGAVDPEELGRHMVGVGLPHRDNHHTGPHVKLGHE